MRPHNRLSIISLFISLVALVLAIISVLWNKSENEIVNYLGITMGILSLLVTVLIGWQIFVLMDLKNYHSAFKDLSKRVDYNDNLTRGYASLGYAHTNIGWLTEAKKEEWFVEYIRHSLLALSFFSKAEDYKTCWAIVNELTENINKADAIYYNGFKDNKKEWIDSIGDVNSSARIENFKDLVKIISSL